LDKVLVIGGSGFLGSHVADKLSDSGFRVSIFDISPSKWIRDDQEFIEGSILDKDSLADAITGKKYVYHFAGIADIGESKISPEKTIELNILGTTNVLQGCVEKKVNRFIFASSMYVYSSFGSFYNASKKSSEIIIEAFNQEYGLDFTFLRYGSLYGPRAQDWNGINSFIKQIVYEGELDYFGSGEEKREYIHASDAADLSLEILSDEYANKAITITGLQVLNSKELIDMIFEIADKEPVVRMNKQRNNDHYVKTPYRHSVMHARKLTPKSFVDIGQGILEIIDSLKEPQDDES
jgi:UDP-glucose 4-epimerase